MSEDMLASGQLKLGWRKEDERLSALEQHGKPFYLARPMAQLQTWNPTKVILLLCQWMMGSCAGHAIAHLGQLLNWIKTGEQRIMSRMYGYLMGQEHDRANNGDHGATIAGCVAGASQDGFCLETTFPYPEPVHYTNVVPEAARAEGRRHLLRSHSVLKSYADAQLWLGNGLGGIDIGIDWLQGLANFHERCLELHHLTGSTLGGHSVCLIALSDKLDEHGRNYVWLGNSHGEQWGYVGWAEVAPAVIERWLATGAVFIGVSDMEEYEPRAIPVAWTV